MTQAQARQEDTDVGFRTSTGTRPRGRLLAGTVLAFVALAGCSGEGISLPTVTGSDGEVALPSVSVSLPSLTQAPRPSASATPETSPEPTPEATDTPEAPPSTTEAPDPTEAPTPTQAPTPTETVTETATPEPVPTRTETVAVQPIVSPTPTPTPTPSPTPAPSTTVEAAPAPDESADDSLSPWVWLLAVAAVAAALAAFLVPRSRRRAAWAADLTSAQSDAAWFAGVLLPQLQQTRSPDALAGGWRVGGAQPVAELEDRLTALVSSAPDEQAAARGRELRDAVRDTRLGVEGLIASGDGTASERVLGSLASSLTAVIERGQVRGPG